MVDGVPVPRGWTQGGWGGWLALSRRNTPWDGSSLARLRLAELVDSVDSTRLPGMGARPPSPPAPLVTLVVVARAEGVDESTPCFAVLWVVVTHTLVHAASGVPI